MLLSTNLIRVRTAVRMSHFPGGDRLQTAHLDLVFCGGKRRGFVLDSAVGRAGAHSSRGGSAGHVRANLIIVDTLSPATPIFTMEGNC